MAKPKKTYTAMPEVPEAIAKRYRIVLEVLSGTLTVSEAARQMGMSRNHFQTVMHRGLEGLIAGLSPGAPGRPARPASEQKLREQNEKLMRANEQMEEEIENVERMMQIAAELVRGVVAPRQPRSKRKKKGPKVPDDEPVRRRLARAMELRQMGLSTILVAALLAVSTATVRRWRARHERGERLVARRGRATGTQANRETAELVEAVVRASNGLVGAESLRRTVPGVSRRQAAVIKHRTLTTMENERIAALSRVVVTTPGVVRGFDGMHVATTDRPWWLLTSADAAVPYRTSLTLTEAYDTAAVVAALEHDVARHGAPLVYRVDRAKAHQTDEVDELLAAHGVLVLHGPPRLPRYYGQLERQNREHRAWLDTLGLLDPDALPPACAHMLAALNGLWRRPTLGWRTAREVWSGRPAVVVDRRALREEVRDEAERLTRKLAPRGDAADLAQRLAIEHALTRRGLLRREARGWC